MPMFRDGRPLFRNKGEKWREGKLSSMLECRNNYRCVSYPQFLPLAFKKSACMGWVLQEKRGMFQWCYFVLDTKVTTLHEFGN